MAKLQTAKFLLAKFRLPVYAQTLMFMPMSKIRYQDVRLFLCSLTLSKKWQYGESLSSGMRKLVHKPIVIVLGKSKDILIPAKMYNICNFFWLVDACRPHDVVSTVSMMTEINQHPSACLSVLINSSSTTEVFSRCHIHSHTQTSVHSQSNLVATAFTLKPCDSDFTLCHYAVF